jgi:hypothetical protein
MNLLEQLTSAETTNGVGQGLTEQGDLSVFDGQRTQVSRAAGPGSSQLQYHACNVDSAQHAFARCNYHPDSYS